MAQQETRQNLGLIQNVLGPEAADQADRLLRRYVFVSRPDITADLLKIARHDPESFGPAVQRISAERWFFRAERVARGLGEAAAAKAMALKRG